jgi:fatty-acyl-CoA synthase
MSNTDEPGFHTLDAVRRLGGPPELVRLTELTGLLQPDDPINIQFTMFVSILNHPSFAQYDLSTLRLGFIGGSPCPIATLTHHGILNNGFFFGEVAGVREGDRFCTPMPLYHVGGMVLGSICGIAHGITIVSARRHAAKRLTVLCLNGFERCQRVERRARFVCCLRKVRSCRR